MGLWGCHAACAVPPNVSNFRASIVRRVNGIVREPTPEPLDLQDLVTDLFSLGKKSRSGMPGNNNNKPARTLKLKAYSSQVSRPVAGPVMYEGGHIWQSKG